MLGHYGAAATVPGNCLHSRTNAVTCAFYTKHRPH
jgi:hypothetical protein